MGKYKRFKVFGERNCGTKYLEQLVLFNSDLQSIYYQPGPLALFLLKNVHYDFVIDRLILNDRKSSLGWKHGLPEAEVLEQQKKDFFVLFIVKNPYSYLLSLFDKPYHYRGKVPKRFIDFLKREWPLRKRDGLGAKSLSSPIELWNLKNKAYFSYSTSGKVVSKLLQYENLVKDSQEQLTFIFKAFGLERYDEFYELSESTNDSDKTHQDYRDYYLQEKWKSRLDEVSIKFINERLDHELVEQLGYTILDSTQ